ncbi:MAG: 4Fe-4S dicluster domain-containing protein, partial [Oscillospiraceae bacterium]|nr:4Fe-4S dicluster domain-containing protein [Oscillospiraceae bacterium]
HATENFGALCGEFLAAFKGRMGTDNCAKLQGKYRTEENRCLKTVELTAMELERYLVKLGKIPAPETKTTLKPEQIDAVKAEGFLINKRTNNFSARVITRNGRVTSKELTQVASAADKFGDGHIVMTTRLNLEVSGIPYESIEDFKDYIGQAGLAAGGTGAKVRPVVSCKGTTCRFGLIDPYGLTEKIYDRVYLGYTNVKLPHKFKIAVGGSPNNCVKPDLNDFGVVGQRIPAIDESKCQGCKSCKAEKACPIGNARVSEETGRRLITIDKSTCIHCGRCVAACPFVGVTSEFTGYKIYLAGRWGKQVSIGKPMDKLLSAEDEVLELIESAILLFRAEGVKGERFESTVKRIGFDAAQEKLLSGEYLRRKDEILADESLPKG